MVEYFSQQLFLIRWFSNYHGGVNQIYITTSVERVILSIFTTCGNTYLIYTRPNIICSLYVHRSPIVAVHLLVPNLSTRQPSCILTTWFLNPQVIHWQLSLSQSQRFLYLEGSYTGSDNRIHQPSTGVHNRIHICSLTTHSFVSLPCYIWFWTASGVVDHTRPRETVHDPSLLLGLREKL